MALPVRHRVQKRRAALRAAGLRPVQIWAPDTRAPGFAEECRRQSRLVAEADLITVAFPGDFGKPRPALIVQADLFEATGTVTVLLISATFVEAPLIRLAVQPSALNGLRKPSQVMIDKVMSVRRDRVGEVFGRLEAKALVAVSRSLAVFLGVV